MNLSLKNNLFCISPKIISSDLSSTAKLCWSVLASSADENGLSNETIVSISEMLNLPEWEISVSLTKLEKAKEIKIQQKNGSVNYRIRKVSEHFFHCFDCNHKKSLQKSEKEVNHLSYYTSYNKINNYYNNNIDSRFIIIFINSYYTSYNSHPKNNNMLFLSDRVKPKERPKLARRKTLPVVKDKIKDNILQYIKIWESKGGIKHRRETKIFQKAIKSLSDISKGIFFRKKKGFEKYKKYKLSPLDFEISTNYYFFALNSPECLPINKKTIKLSLPDFLYNPFGKQINSYFLHFLKNEPISINGKLLDLYPDITNSIIAIFNNRVCGLDNGSVCDLDLAKFIEGSKKTHGFFLEFEDEMCGYFNLTPELKAELVFNAIEKDVRDFALIIPGMFCSNKTFTHRLPAYLKSQALLKEQNMTSPLL